MKEKRLAIPLKELTQYIRVHRMLGMALAFAVLSVYAKQAFSTDFYMDAEVVLNNPHSMYQCDLNGRFGLVALKYLTGNIWYNPYLEAVLFLAVLWVSGMAFSYLFSLFYAKNTEAVGFLSAAIFLFFPTHADQFMFRFQSFEVAVAMLFVVLSTRYFYMAFTEKDIRAYIAAALLDVLSFGIYQSMAGLQICFHIAVWLFTVETYGKAERIRLLRCELVHFLASLTVYGVIVKLFFGGANYLGGQMGWFSGDILSVVRNLLAYVKRILLSMDVFYPITYPACVGACIGMLIWVFLRKRQMMIPYLIGLGGMLASPFFLAIAMGTPSPYRAQCMLPFVCAALWLFFTSRSGRHGGARYAYCIIAGCIFLLCQTSVLLRLFYTQDVIRDADAVTAVQIMERIEEAGVSEADGSDEEKPVVFLGHLDAKTNGSCYTKEEAASYLSYSVYEFAYIEGVPVDTPDYFNTGRILGYFETLGFPYNLPSVGMTEEAKAVSRDMGSWPASDSVRETEEYFIVKLSD